MLLNQLLGYTLPQYYIVFNDKFLLITALRSNIVPSNQVDLVQCSTKSIANTDTILSVKWFNQYYSYPNNLESNFIATFKLANFLKLSKYPLITDEVDRLNIINLTSEGDIDSNKNNSNKGDMILDSVRVANNIVNMNPTFEGASTKSNINCKREQRDPNQYHNIKVKI